MADKRSALIKSFGYRANSVGGAFTETTLLTEESSIEPAAGRTELADGTSEKAGSAHRLTLVIVDPDIFSQFVTWQDDAETLDFQFTFFEGPDNTAQYLDMGFTVTPIEPGEAGQLEGVRIESFVYGLSYTDYVTLSEALGV